MQLRWGLAQRRATSGWRAQRPQSQAVMLSASDLHLIAADGARTQRAAAPGQADATPAAIRSFGKKERAGGWPVGKPWVLELGPFTGLEAQGLGGWARQADEKRCGAAAWGSPARATAEGQKPWHARQGSSHIVGGRVERASSLGTAHYKKSPMANRKGPCWP